MGSPGFVVFVHTPCVPGGRWDHPGSLDSLALALSWMSLGVVWFTRARPVGCWVHPLSLGSLACALGIVGFIRGHCVHYSLGDVLFIWNRCVRSSAPLGSLGSSGVLGFIRARSGGPGVHSRTSLWSSLGSLARTLGIVGFSWGRWVHSRTPCGSLGSSGVVEFSRACPGGHWVHSQSLCSLVVAIGVVGVHPGSFDSLTMGSYEVVAFNHVRRRGRWVRLVSLVSIARAVGVVGFIRKH